MNLKKNQFLKTYLKGIFVIFVICVLPWILSYWFSFFEAIAFWLDVGFLYFMFSREKNNKKFHEDVITLGEYFSIETIKELYSLVTVTFISTIGGILILLVVIALLGGILGILVFGWKQLL